MHPLALNSSETKTRQEGLSARRPRKGARGNPPAPCDPHTARNPHPRLSTGKTRWVALMRFLLPILAPGERRAAHRLKQALNFD